MKLIDKDALVAEIERLRKIQPTDEFQPKEQNKIDWLAGKEFAIITLQMFLDTLEVKDVDLEQETQRILNEHFFYPEEDDELKEIPKLARYIAHHFFELGFKAQKGE